MIQENSTISTYRLATTEGAKKAWSGSTTLSNVSAYIEPLNPEVAPFLDDQNAYLQYRMIVNEVVDIRIGDKVVDQASTVYYVRGILPYKNNFDVDNHIEAILTEKYD